jgi:hypothetical protein
MFSEQIYSTETTSYGLPSDTCNSLTFFFLSDFPTNKDIQ